MEAIYSPNDPVLQADPFPVYRTLRDEHAAYCNDEIGGWAHRDEMRQGVSSLVMAARREVSLGSHGSAVVSARVRQPPTLVGRPRARSAIRFG